MSFTFAFDDAPSTATGPSTEVPDTAPKEALRAARELSLSELENEAATWPTEEIEVARGAKRLTKVMPPEMSLPDLLHEELEGEQVHQDVTALMGVSDLLPDVYEGGFKVWECARDLMEVLLDLSRSGELSLAGVAVLEAGCGAGLPAVLAMQLGARHLVLQDYNPSVLRTVTMPTVQLNDLWAHAEAGAIRFISGDWACVSRLLVDEQHAEEVADPIADVASGTACPNGRPIATDSRSDSQRRAPARQAEDPCGKEGFDVLLSADTLYSASAGRRLWQLVQEQLRPGGTALIAAKSYYFGCGGSVADFKTLVASDARFECRTLRTFEDGASNRRECFAVRHTGSGRGKGKGDADDSNGARAPA